MYAGYYDQAISATAPDPAAARLWEEYLYSTEGQNLFLEGSTRPIEHGRDDHGGHDRHRPPPPRCRPCRAASSLTLPTIAQQTTAGNVVAQQWPSVSG